MKTLISAREREVVLLLIDGLGIKEVGDRLGISARTAHAHINHVRSRLGARTIAQLVAMFYEEEYRLFKRLP